MYDFYSFTRAELAQLLKSELGIESYRSQQLYEWVYRRGMLDFASMSNISKLDRKKLSELFEFPKAKVLERQISKDGTRKYLLEVAPDLVVESVMIKQPKRMTLCVSSQKGCGMGCSFCRTATMGFQGNLTSGDIIRQVLLVMEDAKNFDDMFQNIVFMGMGEPLHNYDNVVSALKILTDEQGLGIGPRKITVSTVGLVPAIEKFGNESLGVNLAVSLNATTDTVRSDLMPINKKFNLEKLVQTLKNFPLAKRKKITIEYVMLAGVNDTDADLKRLVKILRGVKVKMNLIPYNENAGLGFKSPTKAKILRWNHYLNEKGMSATIRWSKGQDIDAACGQLKVSKPDKSSSNKFVSSLATVMH